MARATVSRRALRPTRPRASASSAATLESIVETAFDSPAALNAGDAGSHAAERLFEAPGTFSGCAWATAKPSATISARPNAKLTHLRAMRLCYAGLRAEAIGNADEKSLIRPCRARPIRAR